MQTVLGVVAAMPQEIAPFLRRVGSFDKESAAGFNLFRFRLAGASVVLIESGMGPSHAAAATRKLIEIARPGVILALQGGGLKVDHRVTVFAGMEVEATRRARDYFEGAPPSSPQAAILKDGQLVQLLGRPSFLDRTPEDIAEELCAAVR